MSDCDAVLRRLWELLDGELTREEASRIRRHLTECERCRPHYRYQLRFLNALVRSYARADVPRPEFVARLRVALERMESGPAR